MNFQVSFSLYPQTAIPVSSSPSTISKTLYRTLLVESDDAGGDSLSPVLIHARFLVDRCVSLAEAVNLFRDHDLVLIHAQNRMPSENLRHLVSWLRHNSEEGAEPVAIVVAGENVIKELDGLPCDLVEQESAKTKLPAHLKHVRTYLDTKRKHGDSSFWSRLFGRGQSPVSQSNTQELPQGEKEAEPPDAQNFNGRQKKIVETKTGQHMNSPKREESAEKAMTPAGVQPVTPLVPRGKVEALKTVSREVTPFRRPLEISSITPILFKEISEAAVVLGQDFRVIEANEAWLNLFDTEKGGVLGSAGVEFKTGFDKVAWENILHRALLGREFDADHESLDPPIQSLKVRPVPGEDGTPKGVLVLCKSMSANDLKLSRNGASSAQAEKTTRTELEQDVGRQKVRINDLSTELTDLRTQIKKAEEEAKAAKDALAKEQLAAKAVDRKYRLQRERFDELIDALGSARMIRGDKKEEAMSLLAKVGSPKMDLSLLDHAPFGIVHLSPVGEVIFANARVDGLMGFSIDRAQSFTDWIAKGRSSDETSAALVDEWTDKVWRRQMTCVVQVAGDDGLLKDLEFRPALMDDGGLLVFISDVTDRKQVYDALSSAEIKFRGVFRSTMAGVALMGADGYIYDANAKFCEMFTRERGDVCSTTLAALIEESGGDSGLLTKSEKPHCFTLPNGEQAVLVFPTQSADGNTARAIFCVPVPDEANPLSAASDHEVRAGLQTMVSLVEEWRQSVDGEGDQARHDLLMRWFTVLSAVLAQDGQNEVDIGRVVRDLIAETRRRMGDSASAHVLFDAPVDERFIPRAKALPLALAVSELIDNAIQHGLKNGKVDGLVRVHFTRNEAELIAEICDTGAELRRGFEFEKHAGEGLKLARLLVKRLGGKLRIDPGTETRCQLNIPLG